MNRLGIDFRATLPQTIGGLVGGVIVFRYLLRPSLAGETKPPQSALNAQVPKLPLVSDAFSWNSFRNTARSWLGMPRPTPESAPALIRQLDSPNSLDEIGRGKTVLLIARGYSAADVDASRASFRAAAARFGNESLQFFEVTPESALIPATTLLTRLGITHEKPFVMVLDNFIMTEKKYLSYTASVPTVPTADEIVRFLESYLSGQLQPARLGQVRPVGDAATNCRHLTEVVTDSFNELVLDPYADVLVECYTRRCDACKAFSPRYRMLACLCASIPEERKHQGRAGYTLRIAAMDILDNDRDISHLPEKWTPSLRFFPATGSPSVAKSSILYENSSSTSSADGGNTVTKVYLPTLPELLDFVVEHSQGRLTLTPTLIARADALEESAVALESAYDACLKYMQLWQSYSEIVEDAHAQALEKGEKDGSERMREVQAAQASADALRALIIDAYRFLVDLAGDVPIGTERGLANTDAGVSLALNLLDKIADHVSTHGVSQVVADAMNR